MVAVSIKKQGHKLAELIILVRKSKVILYGFENSTCAYITEIGEAAGGDFFFQFVQ